MEYTHSSLRRGQSGRRKQICVWFTFILFSFFGRKFSIENNAQCTFDVMDKCHFCLSIRPFVCYVGRVKTDRNSASSATPIAHFIFNDHHFKFDFVIIMWLLLLVLVLQSHAFFYHKLPFSISLLWPGSNIESENQN